MWEPIGGAVWRIWRGPAPTVRRQVFWVQRRLKLRESSAHLVGFIMRRVACDASVVLRASFV
jgi:hypothetical protein